MQYVTNWNEITVSKTITDNSIGVGVRVISWSWHWCLYFDETVVGWRGMSQCVGHVELGIQTLNQVSKIEISHIARRGRGGGTETPRYNRGVTVSVIAITIVTSRRQMLNTCLSLVVVSQSEARISTEHGINHRNASSATTTEHEHGKLIELKCDGWLQAVDR